MESKHTKGVARIYNTKAIFEKRESLGIDVEHEKYCRSIILFQEGEAPSDTTGEEDLANAQLIVDAFNVTNETGLTPRELQNSHAELLEALIKCKDELLYNYKNEGASLGFHEDVTMKHIENNSLYQSCLKAIANATKKS